MRKSKKSERKTIILLVAVLLFMAVGFAAYSTTLYIGGENGKGSQATFKANKWSVHYVTGTLTDNNTSTVENAISKHNLTETDFEFAVTLSKPGDTYTATWDVTNDGNYDAVLKKINMSTLTEAQAKYVTYTIAYDGGTYSTTTANVNKELAINATKQITLTLTYVKPEKATDLPTEDDVTIDVSGSFEYEEKPGA